MTDYVKWLPVLFAPQGRPDVPGRHSIKSCFFGIEKRNLPSCPSRLPLLVAMKDLFWLARNHPKAFWSK